jgi:hypothetical protein
MNILEKLQQGMIALSELASAYQTAKDSRRGLALLGNFLRDSPKDQDAKMRGFISAAQQHAEEVAAWVAPEDIAAGKGGPFDACDLRIYIELAKRAGIPFVPAHQILTLSEPEMSVLSGQIKMPHAFKATAERQTHRKKLAVPCADDLPDGANPLAWMFNESKIDPDALDEKLSAAMDSVPEGWMVRSARCGSSNLKHLAGCGLAGPVAPEVKFGPNLEIGPGWIRKGNRRQVHVSDHRTMESYAQGPGGDIAFLARPWITPARLVRCDDPHRAGTPYAGPGWWPVEIRAYIVDGKVSGCSNYYSWIELPPSPETARLMLQARDMAQAVADEATRQKAYPRYMDLEFIRTSQHPQIADDAQWQSKLELFGRNKVAFTLDFLEVKLPTGGSTLVMLEGGPPASPVGGGHPTGFAGREGAPKMGSTPNTNGVAFQSMDHIIIGDPKTWCPGVETDRILSWKDTEALATR